MTTCTADVFLLPIPSLFIIIAYLGCFAIRSRYPGRPLDDNDTFRYKNHSTLGATNISGKNLAVNREAINAYRSAREKRENKAWLRMGLSVFAAILLVIAFSLQVLEMGEYACSRSLSSTP